MKESALSLDNFSPADQLNRITGENNMDFTKDAENLNTNDDQITPRDLFIEDETQCALCGTDLLFQYQIEPLTLVVDETACCPSCKIQMKNRSHKLH